MQRKWFINTALQNQPRGKSICSAQMYVYVFSVSHMYMCLRGTTLEWIAYQEFHLYDKTESASFSSH